MNKYFVGLSYPSVGNFIVETFYDFEDACYYTAKCQSDSDDGWTEDNLDWDGVENTSTWTLIDNSK